MGIDEIAGIGDAFERRLSAAGVSTVEVLLDRAGRRLSRERLAVATGISTKLLLEWVSRADLMRIGGVSGAYADLLEAAGVDSCVELSRREPANLRGRLAEVNEVRSLARLPPTEREVAGWVVAARSMPRVVQH